MEVYYPQEDSYLLLEAVEKHAFGAVLEIGTGTGILAIGAAKKKNVSSVTAVDINEKALKIAKQKAEEEKVSIKLLRSDLFQKASGKFDTIIFNPPYLPQDEGIEDPSIYGGKRGHETIMRFLSSAGEHMEDDGIILLLFSTLTNKEKINDIMEEFCYEHKVLSEKSLFFEKLFTYKIYKSNLLKEMESKGAREIKRFAKGKRGIIYIGKYKGKTIAIKVQRKDSSAVHRMENEAKWLERLNKTNIGPKLLLSGEKYVAYEFVKGEFLLDYARRAHQKELKSVIIKCLEQCLVLDKIGVNKEEMHHPTKHILIDSNNKPILIDFERCRNTQDPKNITQFLEFLARTELSKKLGLKTADLRKIAKQYSKDRNERLIFQLIEGEEGV